MRFSFKCWFITHITEIQVCTSTICKRILSSRVDIRGSPYGVCAFASVPTIVGICLFSVKTNRSLYKLGGAGSSAAMYADTKAKLSPFRHTLLTLIATISLFENIGIREQ